MPHVILQGSVTLEDLAGRHAPFVVREGDRLVKADRLYVDTEARAALLETLVVDRGHTQKFFIQIQAREGGLTVRLEPLTDPEKNDAVKRALAIVALRIRDAAGCRVAGTNIAAYLEAPVLAAGGE